jgi:Fe2+ transport system protein FeoA
MVLSPDRAFGGINTEMKLAKADLLIGLGSIHEATAALTNVVATDPRSTPEALTKLLKLSLNSDKPTPEDDLALADIMRFEYRGQPVIEPLVKVQARVLTEAGEINRTLALLAQEVDTLSEEETAQLTSIALLKAVEVFPEREFLDLAFSKTAVEALPKAQNAMAKRLLEFGLAERASLLVAGSANSGELSERRYLRAEAALELDLAPVALAELAGLGTPRANLLRERATLQAAKNVGNGEIAAGDDWRQGNWTSLNQSNDELFKSVSETILERVISEPVGILALASSQGLISKSEESRKLIGEIFARFAPITE